MTERWQTAGGVTALIGSGLLFVSSIPAGWYGYEPTDSYVFDPALGSPLWIKRELLPLLAFLGTVALLVGVGTVVYRDWETSRSLNWGGSLSLLGGVGYLAGLYGPDLVGPQGAPAGPVPELAGFALMLWGGLLLLIGGPLLAYAYLTAGRRRLGWTLLAFIPAGIVLGTVLPGWLGELGGALPALFIGGALAWDLYFRPPLSREV